MGASESKELAELMDNPQLKTYTRTELKTWEERFNARYPCCLNIEKYNYRPFVTNQFQLNISMVPRCGG